MQKRLFATSALAVLLTACGASPDVSYHVTYTPNADPTQHTMLAEAAGRVIERRVESMGGTTTKLKVTEDADKKGAMISFTVNPASLHKPLTEQVEAPYSMRLMRSTKAGETPTVNIEGKSYIETGVTEKDLEWVSANKDQTDPAKGVVYITFTTAGKAKVKKVFQTTKGLSVAIFVRDRLISSFQNTKGAGQENILIENVPAYDLATAFADDVVVGSFMTFTER
jgi:hypothetical protein